jgi:glycine/D-amino acid oxidase-like deaminating enzyme
MVHLDLLLPAWRNKLLQEGSMLEENFEIGLLEAGKDSVSYKDIRAEKIIFCDGINSMSYPFFQKLPFAFNKGEMLLMEIEDLSPVHIYKKGLMLAPVSENLWWLGSNYEWDYENDLPGKSFRESSENTLKNWLKIPYRIVEHKASLRPATIERRPFVGIHPHHPAIGILNGMGTKGCSLSPWFARQFCNNLINGTPIDPEASIQRFSRVLSS